MDRRAKLAAAGSIFVLVVIVIAVSAILIKRFTPSREVMPLEEYYQAEEGDVLVMLHDQYCEETAKLIDGQIYFRFDMVQELFNHRFYWDENENILSYTTPTEIIRAEVGSQDYTVNMNKTTAQYQIVKTQGDAVYLAAEFVKQYSDMDYQFYEDPDRVTVQYEWKDYLYADVRRATQLSHAGCRELDLTELEFRESVFTSCTFSQCDFSHAALYGCVFRRCRFDRCRFAAGYWKDVLLEDCRADGADLRRCRLKSCVLWDCRLPYANLTEIVLDRTVLQNCCLRETALSSAKLSRTSFQKVDLSGAELFRTILSGLDLSSCTLDGISLSQSCAELRGARINASQAAVVARILGIEVV